MVITDIDDKIIKKSWEVKSHIETRDGCTSFSIIWILYMVFTTGKYLFNRDRLSVWRGIQEGHVVIKGVWLEIWKVDLGC